ncbi:MAG: T9SS type A sorting domain-containing protein [Flavobacteriales bacterium]|nr:T9SS type A sorting domain-containing protein [Flavobacteriales bacterium]
MSLHCRPDSFISTVSMDIFDLSGKRMIARTVGIQDGLINTTIDLSRSSAGGDLADGMYVVKVTAGDEVFTQRMVIQK